MSPPQGMGCEPTKEGSAAAYAKRAAKNRTLKPTPPLLPAGATTSGTTRGRKTWDPEAWMKYSGSWHVRRASRRYRPHTSPNTVWLKLHRKG